MKKIMKYFFALIVFKARLFKSYQMFLNYRMSKNSFFDGFTLFLNYLLRLIGQIIHFEGGSYLFSYTYISTRYFKTRTTDTQWRHNSKISEKLGQCGRQNMLWLYLKIWDWDWIFGRAVKANSSLGVRSPWGRTPRSISCIWLLY